MSNPNQAEAIPQKTFIVDGLEVDGNGKRVGEEAPQDPALEIAELKAKLAALEADKAKKPTAAKLAQLEGAATTPPQTPDTSTAREQNATPLPEGFPAREALLDGGFSTLEAVRAAEDVTLLTLKGVGATLLDRIRKAQ